MIQRFSSFSSRSNAPRAVALSLVVLFFGVAACFSERATVTDAGDTAACSAPSTTAGATIIFIRSFAFQTATVHVKSGGRVAWVNCEPTNIQHTSTSDASGWDSGLLTPPASFVRTFPTVGSFPYHCTVHPGMKATVIVE
ncbi:MAG TPA: plastocyanin/azurin family copper-binding protein [Gemmatimonadaceae bacterium]|nr:plastocyanin/azurin family copper-binding protein [Gemmatimonadaceae bacterium]